MEEILIGIGITFITEAYKFLYKKYQNKRLAWGVIYGLVFAFSLLAVIFMNVAPKEFLETAVQIIGSSITFYEVILKRVVNPASNNLN